MLRWSWGTNHICIKEPVGTTSQTPSDECLCYILCVYIYIPSLCFFQQMHQTLANDVLPLPSQMHLASGGGAGFLPSIHCLHSPPSLVGLTPRSEFKALGQQTAHPLSGGSHLSPQTGIDHHPHLAAPQVALWGPVWSVWRSGHLQELTKKGKQSSL